MPQLAVAIVLGSLLAFYGNELPDQFWTAFAPILLLLACYCRVYRPLLLAAAVYLWSSGLFHYHLDHRLIDAYDHQLTSLRGVVSGLPEVKQGRIRLYLKDPEIEGYPGNAPRLIRLNWYQDRVVPRAGESWQFMAKLRQPRGLMNPGGFDLEAWQFIRGIDAVGYIRDSPLNTRLSAASPASINYWRSHLASKVDQHCPDCAHRGLIKALLLGFRGDIKHAEKSLLQSSGTAHLLAISGLHIGMLAFIVFALGGYCWRIGLYRGGLNRMQTAALLALVAASGYAALAGFSLPTVRALVMLTVVILASMLGNRINLLQSLALAAGLILLVDPRAVGSSSFWLSVGALLVIAFVKFRLPLQMRWWQQLLVLQVGFSLLFAPLGLLIFEQFNPAGLLANLVAIPVVSFVVLPAVLIGGLLAFFGLAMARPLFMAVDAVLEALLDYLDLLLSSGLDPIEVALPAPLVLLALGMVTWYLMPVGLYARAVTLLGLSILLIWQPARPERGAFEMVVFDVGMGTSILVRTRHHSLVYDFGPGKEGVYSAADWALLPALRADVIDWPDLAIVSHVDQDHSGGLYPFASALPPLTLLSGTPSELKSRFGFAQPPRSCHQYPGWRWDGIEFSFLASVGSLRNSNNRSCVLMIEGNQRVLLPGDIESRRESNLVADFGTALHADVMVVPHHGSATSSSPAFVDRVAPRHVVYTLSRGNRWGFPAPAVVARYNALEARQYRSDRDGAITISSGPEGLSIRTGRHPVRRFWRRW
jgi:competence protein ComEC